MLDTRRSSLRSSRPERPSRSAQRAEDRHTAVDVTHNTPPSASVPHGNSGLTPSRTSPAPAAPRGTRQAARSSRRPSACTRRRPGPAGRRRRCRLRTDPSRNERGSPARSSPIASGENLHGGLAQPVGPIQQAVPVDVPPQPVELPQQPLAFVEAARCNAAGQGKVGRCVAASSRPVARGWAFGSAVLAVAPSPGYSTGQVRTSAVAAWSSSR
jgi:hypothetical protein